MLCMNYYHKWYQRSQGGRDSDPVSSQLSSVACASLLSLVVGLGDTSKMLSAISMMLVRSSQLSGTM